MQLPPPCSRCLLSSGCPPIAGSQSEACLLLAACAFALNHTHLLLELSRVHTPQLHPQHIDLNSSGSSSGSAAVAARRLSHFTSVSLRLCCSSFYTICLLNNINCNSSTSSSGSSSKASSSITSSEQQLQRNSSSGSNSSTSSTSSNTSNRSAILILKALCLPEMPFRRLGWLLPHHLGGRSTTLLQRGPAAPATAAAAAAAAANAAAGSAAAAAASRCLSFGNSSCVSAASAVWRSFSGGPSPLAEAVPPAGAAAGSSSSSGSAGSSSSGSSGKGRRKSTGLHKVCSLGGPLAEFMGRSRASRVEVTKYLWAYIKEKDLQSKANKQMIVPDERLFPLLQQPELSMFQLNKVVSKYIHNLPPQQQQQQPQQQREGAEEGPEGRP
ncbi:hypothetical protein Esti_005663 [Eimeria stiedai]